MAVQVPVSHARRIHPAISGSFGQIGNAAPALFAAEPIVDVTVTGISDEKAAAKLAKAPWLGGLHSLVVRGEIGDEGFVTLCNTPALAKLRSLNVTANGLGPEALAALDGNLPACKTLVLTANEIGDEGIAGLLAWKQLAQVETLYLSNCALSADGVAELLGGTLTSLRKITLSGNELGDGIATVFASAPRHCPRSGTSSSSRPTSIPTPPPRSRRSCRRRGSTCAATTSTMAMSRPSLAFAPRSQRAYSTRYRLGPVWLGATRLPPL